jgi:hypothetical protein
MSLIFALLGWSGLALAEASDPVSLLTGNCVNGDPSSCTMLAVRTRRAEALLRDACDLNDARACLELGRSFDPMGAERSRSRAVGAREQGCDAGSGPTCLRVGLDRLSFYGEVSRSTEIGVNQLTSACIFGVNAACDLAEAMEPINLTISPKGYWLEGKAVGALELGADGVLRPRATEARGGVLLPMKAAMEPKARALQDRLLAAGASPARVPGLLRVVVEPGVPWSAVEAGLRTAATQGYRDARVTLRTPAGDQVVNVLLPTPIEAITEPNAADLSALLRGSIESEAGAIQRCYEVSLTRRPTLAGKVVIDVQVDENGQVLGARPSTDTMGDADATACIIERVKTMRLPRMADRQPYEASLPFSFTP